MHNLWEIVHPRAQQQGKFDVLGGLMYILDPDDPRKAAEQLDAGYQHGGGWRPFEGFELKADNSIKYPGDPAYVPIAVATLRDETIVLYQSAWVAVIQPDRSFEISRMD